MNNNESALISLEQGKNWRDVLITRLNTGGLFLIIGQDFRRTRGGDTFLDDAVQHFEFTRQKELGQHFTNTNDQSNSYNDLLGLVNDGEWESACAWMYRRSRQIIPPSGLKQTAAFPWNHVLTSAIDAQVLDVFETDWRTLRPIRTEEDRPANPRDRNSLQISFLFGCVDGPNLKGCPPLDEWNFIEREQQARLLLQRFSSFVNPLDVVLIDGWAGQRDWLSPKMLYPVLSKLQKQQVFLFGATAELQKDPIINRLIVAGTVVPVPTMIDVVLQDLVESGDFLPDTSYDSSGDHRIRIGGRSYGLPADVLRNIRNVGILLDDTLPVGARDLREDDKYRELRAFLAHRGDRPVWQSYADGLQFNRSFQTSLYKTVAGLLEPARRVRDQEHLPVILHGSTGTGKTVALEALAYKIWSEGRFPVLFIPRETEPPSYREIAEFCGWIVERSQSVTLIIWDGMEEPGQYHQILQFLSAEGRRVVLVGSSYELRNGTTGNRIDAEGVRSSLKSKRRSVTPILVSAPPEMSREEAHAFQRYVAGFAPKLAELFDFGESTDVSFLVALYRYLPESRRPLREGVVTEFNENESKLIEIAREQPREFLSTAIQVAFARSGVDVAKHLLPDSIEEVAGEQFTKVAQLTALVMVPGQFGISLPIELLLRAAGDENIPGLISLLQHSDIFRWSENIRGNIYVGPRQPLEAQLYVQSTLGTPAIEVNFATKLLKSIRSTNAVPEISFAVDLLRKLGPNSEYASHYQSQFNVLAQALGDLRNQSVAHPRLVLQESSLIREAVYLQQIRPANAEEKLTQTQDLLDRTLRELENDNDRNTLLQSQLRVERASVIRTLITIHSSSNTQLLRSRFYEIRRETWRSRSLDPTSYHALDVFATTALNLIERNALNELESAEAKADLLYLLEAANESDFPADQRAWLESLRQKVGQALELEELTDDAFNRLADSGSAAGFYLRAQHIAGKFSIEESLTQTQRSNLKKAAEFLQANRKNIGKDGRSLFFLFRLWWMSETGEPPLYQTRRAVAFNVDKWSFAASLLEDCRRAENIHRMGDVLFLLAVCRFHLKDYSGSLDDFKDLEGDQAQRFRSKRTWKFYVASNSDGQPQRYSGTVQGAREGGTFKGSVWIPEISRTIPFYSNEFLRDNVKQNDRLDAFHIAFNFFGPIADPIRYFDG